MSWLADIAVKAETFLNKIDHNAAVLVEAAADEIHFQKNESNKHELSEKVPKNVNPSISSFAIVSSNPATAASSRSNAIRSNPSPQKTTSNDVSKTKDKHESRKVFKTDISSNKMQSQNIIDEEKLILFLNEPSCTMKENKCDVKKPECDTTPTSKHNDKNEIVEIVEAIISDILQKDNSRNETAKDNHNENNALSSPIKFSESLVNGTTTICQTILDKSGKRINKINGEGNAVDVTKNQEDQSPKEDTLQCKMENKFLENQSLLDEIASLTEELGRVELRAKEAEKECQSLNESLSSKRCELRQRERRMQESIETCEKVKNQNNQLQEQFGGMKIQLRLEQTKLEEAKSQMIAKDVQLTDEKKKCAEKIIENRENCNERVKSLEDELACLRENKQTILADFHQKELQIKELESKWLMATEQLAQVNQEYEEYKAKAKKVLFEKEKLISSLNETGHATTKLGLPVFSMAQLEQAVIERNLFHDEAQNLSHQMNCLKQEMCQIQGQLVKEVQQNSEIKREAELTVEKEKSLRTRMETELKNRENEICYLQEEVTRQKIDLSSKLREKESEVNQWKVRTTQIEREIQTSSNFNKNDDFRFSKDSISNESRIGSLTEAVLMKQALLEVVTSDKTALALKVEKLENDLAEERKQMNEVHNYQNGSDGLFDKSSQSSLNGKVRKAYTSLDKLSLKTGALLRRYPIARIFVLVYMAGLHLLVFFVLFNSTSDLTLPPAK